MQDILVALRVLRKNPGFAAVAILSLGLGIGANSTIFSLADAMLLRPLPVFEPGEVVSLRAKKSGGEGQTNHSYKDYVDYRDHLKSFSGLAAYTETMFGFAEAADALPQMKFGMYVSGNFFQTMGVEPALGRGFRPDEDIVAGRDAVTVLGFRTWKEQFGSRADAVGKRIRLNGVEFRVIGVAPERFTGMDQYIQPALFVPLQMSPKLASTAEGNLIEKRSNRVLTVKGRLANDVTIQQAQAETSALAASLAQSFPESNKGVAALVRTELEARIERSPSDAMLVLTLSSLVMLVLLVACANVANLLLSRARARTREIAVRLAIGAGRMRLIRQLLTESLIIAIAGGAVGLLVAWGGTAFLSTIEVPSDVPVYLTFKLDQRVLLVSLLLSVVSALLFGLAPALQASKTDLVTSLKASVSDSGKQRIWGRNALVVGQVAISLVLLIAASGLMRGFKQATAADPGFRRDHLMMMKLDPTLVKYTNAQTLDFYKRLVARVRTAPGVKSATLMSMIPLTNNFSGDLIVPEGFQMPEGREAIGAACNVIDEGYFETVGVSIIRGRGFRETDNTSAPRVAIVNELVAQKFWPGKDAIGKRLRIGGKDAPWAEIVGIAKMHKYNWIAEPPMDMVYQPLWQSTRTGMVLMAQSTGDARSLASPLRDGVREIDANQPIYDFRPYADYYQGRAVNLSNLLIEIVSSIGLLGLVLALIGLYGLMAYSVAGRIREIGIRMAIGQSRASVLAMVLRQGMILSGLGIAIGLAGSFVLAPAMASAFMTPPDTFVYIAVPIALMAITMLAALIPARRAAQVDPMVALRYE